MRRKGKALYYDHGDGRWTPLGSDLARAKRLWADMEYTVEQRTVADLVNRFLQDRQGKRTDSTMAQYRGYASTIAKEWGDLPCETLRAPQIARWRDTKGTGKAWANGVITVLRLAYRAGIEWGWCELNPASGVAFNDPGRRERYLTDAEFVQIRDAAPTWLATAMNVSYLTALRPSDVLAMRWDQVGERLTVLPRKTQRNRVSMSFEITPELRAVFDAAKRRPILGLFVVATDKGRPITLRRLEDHWTTVVRSLGITDCQFRDVRAKAATDADAQGQDAQRLLHHTTRAMTRTYLKLGEVRRVEPLRRKL